MPVPEVFFGGARGGGKTDGVLGKWAAKEKRYGQYFNAIMFRRTSVGGRRHRAGQEKSIRHWADVSTRASCAGECRTVAEYRSPIWRTLPMPTNTKAVTSPTPGSKRPDSILRLLQSIVYSVSYDLLMASLSSLSSPLILVVLVSTGYATAITSIPFPKRPIVLERVLPTGDIHKVAVIPSRITDNKILLIK